MKNEIVALQKTKHPVFRIFAWAIRLILIFMVFCFGAIYAQESNSFPLFSTITKADGPSFLQTLKYPWSLKTDFGTTQLAKEDLSAILSAAFKIYHPDHKQDAESTRINRQKIALYVATDEGLYLYDENKNKLKQILAEDIRAMTNRQVFARKVGAKLIYVADLSKIEGNKKVDKELFASADAEAISQNVYLFCLSEGFKSIVHQRINKDVLAKAMQLRPEQKILLTQSLGYPKRDS